MQIGFIGTGNIGAPIAGQLLRVGHDLVIYDRRPDAAAGLLATGAGWGKSSAALADDCEVVITCLPGPKEMEEVCLGSDSLVAHLKPGALYIDHTTNAPALVRRICAMLAEKGVAMLDAPVSGGMEGAQTRDLLVIAGGNRHHQAEPDGPASLADQAIKDSGPQISAGRAGRAPDRRPGGRTQITPLCAQPIADDDLRHSALPSSGQG